MPSVAPTSSNLSSTGRRSTLNEAYTLGPGDLIQVDIFNVPEFSGEQGTYEVLVDGTLSVPLIGNLDVDGMTLNQTRDLLVGHYSTLLTRPPVLTVTLLNPRPLRVAVSGEVNRPGTYTAELTEQEGNSTRQWPTLTQVIQQAGGITQTADIRQVEVRRPQLNGSEVVIEANLWDLIRQGEMAEDITLRDGDTIFIPTAANPLPADSVRISSANFSPETIPVQVVGEVNKPGAVELPANASLNQAILAAGGFVDTRAQTSTVDLVRLNPDGTTERQTYEVDLASSPNDENNPIVRPNDVVIVDRSALATTSDVIGTILNPLNAAAFIMRLFGF